VKLRLAPILISVTVTTLVLFGGWFVYNSVAMKDPVIELAEQFAGVEDVAVDIHQDTVSVELKLNQDADVRAVVEALRRDGAAAIGGKNLQIHIKDQTSAELDAWWSQALFEVAEAMEARKYGAIPHILDSHKVPGMMVQTSIDDTFVYVQLTQGEHVKYVLLERTPQMMGVWGNE